MSSTRISQHLDAPREAVYRALLDPAAITKWRVPHGMSCFIHEFQPRVGGSFRVSLTYDSPAASGKTTAHADTYHGHFAELIPSQRVVEIIEFETRGSHAVPDRCRTEYAATDHRMSSDAPCPLDPRVRGEGRQSTTARKPPLLRVDRG